MAEQNSFTYIVGTTANIVVLFALAHTKRGFVSIAAVTAFGYWLRPSWRKTVQKLTTRRFLEFRGHLW